MLESIRKKLIHWLAKELLPLVEPKDIISFGTNKSGSQTRTFINGKEADINEISSLKRECRVLDELRMWTLMNDYLLRLAQNKMYKEAQSPTEILFAKTVLYVLDVQKTIKSNIEKSI